MLATANHRRPLFFVNIGKFHTRTTYIWNSIFRQFFKNFQYVYSSTLKNLLGWKYFNFLQVSRVTPCVISLRMYRHLLHLSTKIITISTYNSWLRQDNQFHTHFLSWLHKSDSFCRVGFLWKTIYQLSYLCAKQRISNITRYSSKEHPC